MLYKNIADWAANQVQQGEGFKTIGLFTSINTLSCCMQSQDVIHQFKAAMLDYGIQPPANLIADGKLHRFFVVGHKRNSRNGAYKLHLDGMRPAGFIQDYKTGLKVNWAFQGEVKTYTQEEKRAYAKAQKELAAQQAAEALAMQNAAAAKASALWGKLPLALTHPYLVKKGIAAHRARVLKETLVLPLYDAALAVVSLQFINADGDKRYLTGGAKRGSYWWLGQKTQKVLIAEGFATAASLHEATGLQVFIAFDAGNLLAVAKLVRAKRPEATIVLCADNDASGAGKAKADEAALAGDGSVIMPPEVDTDFNDFIFKHGAQALRI